jgi:hypothetical protein
MEKLVKQLLFDAINDGLLTLGESGRKAVYFHLQKTFSLEMEEIPEKPEVFAEGLRKIFGVGAEVIEKSIIKSLYQKLGIEYSEKEDFNFLRYWNEAKQKADKSS